MKEDATFYYIVWGIVLLIALIERLRKKPFNNTIITAIFMMAAVIVACRVEVGTDWDHYRFLYYHGYDEAGRDSSIIEPLFMSIRYISYNLEFTHSVFFLILSLISLFAIRKAAALFGIKYFMTVFLVYYSMFFLNYQFNIVRHGVMASLIWLSFAYKTKGNTKATSFSILAALGFHYSALIFVPFLFVLDRKFSKTLVLSILVAAYLTYFLQLSMRIINSIPILFQLERTASFVTSGEFVKDYGLTIGTQIQVFFSLFLYFKYSESYKSNPDFRLLVNSIILNFLLLCILNAFNAIISRICNAFFMAMIFLLPMFIEKLKEPVGKFIAGFLIIIYLFITLPKTFVIKEDGYSDMLPYRFEIEQFFDKNVK